MAGDWTDAVSGRRPDAVGPGEAAIQAWLVSRLSELLAIPPDEIDVHEPFASYGLGSTELVSLSGDVAEWLGGELPAELAYECPTIESLARRLAAPSSSTQSHTGMARARESDAEAIAIVGIGCRFPGANDARAYWNLLRNGVDAIREVPAERFDLNEYFDPDPTAPGKIASRWGGFVEQVDQFDAHFFGISPREAARMDPQQRLLLEVAWEALEDAGQVRERLAGTSTGVFIGISTNDYGRIQFDDPDRIDAYAGTGNAHSIAANRISYVFDLRGPSIAVDTACSSSLVAVDLACSSLRNGETTLALAGGVNLILSPTITINFTKAGAMAPDGRCKAFDARADGYVRSEGAGVVVLKPLSRALVDRDPIYAVIQGSAVNQDGRSNGLMAPNPLAQEEVLREAYRRAGVSPGDVQYVEAHGTGTFLGDPIEAKALGTVLSRDRPADGTCLFGSAKTNLGHLEAAAGIAGLIKVALALRNREIPPSLHFEAPNPHIPFDRLPLRVSTTLVPWPSHAGGALAGVSSFGFGGTNAHVVVGQAPGSDSEMVTSEWMTENRSSRSTYLLPLSARSPTALQSLAGRYQDLLTDPESTAAPPDVCYTASVRRSHHEYRLAVTGKTAAELAEGLEAASRGEIRPGLSSGRKPSDRRRKTVFVFPGQGSQWFGMGRTLLKQEPVFRDALERCDRAIRPHGDWSLLAELAATDPARSRLNEVDVLQPALFAIQVALAALWRSWGIEPDAVVGHSMGEVAAAHVAGVLDLDDAARVICSRSRLVKPTIGRGAMAAAELSITDARRVLAGYEDRVSIAASNGPSSTVLSGDPGALEAIVSRLQDQDIFCRIVTVDFAAHSPQMEPLRDELERTLEGIQPRPPSVPIYSTVTGTLNGDSSFDPLYWSANLRNPVLFSSAVEKALEDGLEIFLEISPHPILLSSIQQQFRHAGIEGAILPSLRREEDEGAVLAGSLGAFYAMGHPVEWGLLYPEGGRCVPLPFYPWQRERCWLDEPAEEKGSPSRAVSRDGTGKQPLPGRHFRAAQGDTHVWEMALDGSALRHRNEHRVDGVAVVSAALYVEMALAAGAEVFSSRSFVLKDMEFLRALFLPDDGSRTVQVNLSPGMDGAASVRIYSRPDDVGTTEGSWTLHATGTVCPRENPDTSGDIERETPAEIEARCPEPLAGEDYYRQLRERGIDYGPSLQSLVRVWRCDGETLAEVKIPEGNDEGTDTRRIHPAILEGCFQTFGAGVAARAMENAHEDTYMPTRIDEIRVHDRPASQPWSHARLGAWDVGSAEGDVRLLDETGRATVEILGLRFESLAHAAQENVDDWLYEIEWQPRDRADGPSVARSPAEAGSRTWLIFADRGGIGEALAAEIDAAGDQSVLVVPGKSCESIDARHFSIRPEQPEDMRRLLDSVRTRDSTVCRGVVHLWSLDSPPPGQMTVESLEAAQLLGCGSVLHLLHELGRVEGHDVPRLWLITRGVQPAGEMSRPVDLAQAPLWGLGRVIAQEHPMCWGGLLDLDPEALPDDGTAHQLWQEVSASDGEDQIAFRQDRRYAARLVRRRRSGARHLPLQWRPDGSYLITGGLGDLGLSVARWMVEQGARRLILLGRTKLPPRAAWTSVEGGSPLAHKIAAIRELEASGASVHPASVDVADEGQLSAFLDDFRAEGWPPIRGVVHAAGVLQDGLLMQLDEAALTSVLRPKVTGGWLLHRLLADVPLDFFVLFSSAGALLGQPGQGNYAAANVFLDALAHHRRARGQPALSVNWGAWSGAGFADTAGGQRLAARLALFGIESIPPTRALEVLERLLRQSATQVSVVRVDWRRYGESHSTGTESPLLADLAPEGSDHQPQSGHSNGTRTTLLAAEPSERLPLLHSYLSEQVALVLGLSSAQLDLQQPLSNLGLDSLMAVELKNRIAVDLEVNVPMVKFLSGPSVEQAAADLLRLLASDDSPSSAPLASTFDDDSMASKGDRPYELTLGSLNQLSDEEVHLALTNILDKEGVGE